MIEVFICRLLEVVQVPAGTGNSPEEHALAAMMEFRVHKSRKDRAPSVVQLEHVTQRFILGCRIKKRDLLGFEIPLAKT